MRGREDSGDWRRQRARLKATRGTHIVRSHERDAAEHPLQELQPIAATSAVPCEVTRRTKRKGAQRQATTRDNNGPQADAAALRLAAVVGLLLPVECPPEVVCNKRTSGSGRAWPRSTTTTRCRHRVEKAPRCRPYRGRRTCAPCPQTQRRAGWCQSPPRQRGSRQVPAAGNGAVSRLAAARSDRGRLQPPRLAFSRMRPAILSAPLQNARSVSSSRQAGLCR